MNADIFAEWFRCQGYDVFRTECSYWYNQGPHSYQAFPYHWAITPSDTELKDILMEHRAIGLRYSTPLSASVGALSYHTVYEEPEYNFDLLENGHAKM